jgi:hypothetical protein
MAGFFKEARAHGVGLLGPQAKILPYTGVAGFTTTAEVRAVAADAPTISLFSTPHFGYRQLAIGVLVSQETMDGKAPRKYAERYPAIDKVCGIIDAAAEPFTTRASWQPKSEGTVFDLKKRCLRLIHYNGGGEDLCARLDRLCKIAGPNLDGFQLNMVWPPRKELSLWAMDHPTMRLILQVNRRMWANVAQTSKMLIAELANSYSPWCFTDILFDLNGGSGLKFNPDTTLPVIEALYGAFGGLLGIGLDCGLTTHSVRHLSSFFCQWPNLSISAESLIRDITLDPKDPEKTLSDTLGSTAREYTRRAFGAMPIRR